MTTRGKSFETEISRMFQAGVNGVAYIRHHPDLPGRRFTLSNPIDFTGCLQGGRGLFIECKAVKRTSLFYSRFNDEQWEALLCCFQARASVWIFINWYEKTRGRAFAVPFSVMLALQDELWHGKLRRSWQLDKLLVMPGVIQLIKTTRPKPSWRWVMPS